MTEATGPILVPARNPGPLTGTGNNTWLIDGAEPTLIDAGVGVPAHLDEIAAHLGGRPLVRVIVTHGHADHAAGVPALMTRWPGLEPWKWVRAGELGWRALGDGQQLRAGIRPLTVIHTPGHAPDHVCLLDAATGDLFVGDMVTKGTTVMIPAGRGGNLRAYLASLERIGSLRPRRLLPGHGAIVDKPLELIGQYIEHRLAREVQVLECLRDGLTDVDAIVSRIYVGLTDAVRPAARLTVEAHLEKLREEGLI
jgi:glyoxylase-like metal-dependent hydrolase (beta-lactamase superfamily II)